MTKTTETDQQKLERLRAERASLLGAWHERSKTKAARRREVTVELNKHVEKMRAERWAKLGKSE